jgi:hypothetical protein
LAPFVRSVAVAFLLLLLTPRHGAATPAPAADRSAMADFAARVRRCAAERAAAERALPPLVETRDREAIDAHRRALAERLRAARVGGALFTDRTRILFRRLVAAALAERGPGATRASILDDNPGGPPPAANAPYPPGVPLSTVPPAVLKALPALPYDVEYRFVGRHLVVRDVPSSLVLDVVPDALP